jgi:hypothetical protein
MNEAPFNFGEHLARQPDWTMTAVAIHPDRVVERGKRFDTDRQLVDLFREVYTNGLGRNYDRATSGRIAVATDSGNAFLIENGAVMDVKSSLRKKAIMSAELEDINLIEIGKPWLIETTDGDRFFTPVVQSVSISLPTIERVRQDDSRLYADYDPIFVQIDSALANKGL